jgi:hypothetical protein
MRFLFSSHKLTTDIHTGSLVEHSSYVDRFSKAAHQVNSPSYTRFSGHDDFLGTA